MFMMAEELMQRKKAMNEENQQPVEKESPCRALWTPLQAPHTKLHGLQFLLKRLNHYFP